MTMRPLRLGIVGYGKIARDEHLPAIARNEEVELLAVADPSARAETVATYHDVSAMLAAEPTLDAIILSQPPHARFPAARAAILAGKHVFLEKPPGTTVSEVQVLADLAQANGVTMFAGWHSRWSRDARALKSWCSAHELKQAAIVWHEDVRRWHPGQSWIWERGGFGVLDPGINALSILTDVVPQRVRLIDAELSMPANRATPIAAHLSLEAAGGAPITASFDWRHTGPQTWTIDLEDQDGERFQFDQGSAHNGDPGAVPASALAVEYRAMLAHFVGLVRTARSEVDLAPLELIADAYLQGRVKIIAPFED